jgi:PIN domain nuclease of toxin-antitoxin system
MKLLVDTHLLLWAAYREDLLSAAAYDLLNADTHQLWFSTVSLWEVALKRAKHRSDFQWDPGPLRQGLLESGYLELQLSGSHVLAFATSAPQHRDSFDRLLLAQASAEGMLLMTADHELHRFDGPMHFVG